MVQICGVITRHFTIFLFFATVVSVFTGCHTAGNHELNPEASIASMQVEEGFEVTLVAAEPLVIAPVAMTFDGKGRIWVVEMDGYMPDTLGTGEDQPVGRIAILDDTDGDGRMDKRHVFLDSLVMPRAICLMDSGKIGRAHV